MAKRVTIEQFATEMRKLPKKLEAAIVKGLRSAALRGHQFVVEEIDHASPRPAVDRGELRQSVASQRIEGGARLYVDAPHAAIMELGTRPFWPPQEPLAEWALRKGLADDEEEAAEVAFAVARTIATFGIAPRHYFKKGVQRTYLVIPEELQRALEEI